MMMMMIMGYARLGIHLGHAAFLGCVRRQQRCQQQRRRQQQRGDSRKWKAL